MNREPSVVAHLHVADVLPVPQRLKHEVGKPQDGQVLDQLLAQVVVDTVDLLLPAVHASYMYTYVAAAAL